jgi:hypothetical protein
LQDNNGFYGPSNSLSPDGILNSYWRRVVGGDGMWAIPNPADPQRIWADLQAGRISIFDERTGFSRSITPAYQTSAAEFSLYAQPYRFNWDSPIGFAPWDPHTAWLGGNVVFQTVDDGAHWTVISPDLTRNIKSHQYPSGGPLALDVSSAEFSDNLLDIEGSPVTKGEIWAGTDDGYVQLTRDGGAHWSNVTPSGAPELARVETVAPSPLRAGAAYAIFDDHRSGNYRPYLYATTDYGSTWRKIVNGLPQDQYVRTVRPDIRNPNVLYAGTEQGIWVSYNGGNYWQSLQLNLPTVSVRDIRLQPTFDDIIIATHGRALWILDDAQALQHLTDAQAAGVMLFPLRPAYEYSLHSDIEDVYTWYAAANPPNGVIIDFYQAAPQPKTPLIQVLDSNGRIVRTLAGTHKVKGKDVSNITNDRGLNRVIWDFKEDGPVQWMGAAREEYRGPKEGARLPPGAYTVHVTLGGRVLAQTVDVRPDPRLSFTQDDYVAWYQFQHRFYVAYSNVDIALNNLDAVKKGLLAAIDTLHKGGGAKTAALAQAQTTLQARDRVFNQLTANYMADEDSIQRPGALREELERFQDISSPPLPALVAFASKIDDQYKAVMNAYNAFVDSVGTLNTTLRSAGVKEVQMPHRVST